MAQWKKAFTSQASTFGFGLQIPCNSGRKRKQVHKVVLCLHIYTVACVPPNCMHMNVISKIESRETQVTHQETDHAETWM